MNHSTVAALIMTGVFIALSTLLEMAFPIFQAKTYLIAVALFFAFNAFFRATGYKDEDK